MVQRAILTHEYDGWWAVDVIVERDGEQLPVFGDNVEARDVATAQRLATEMLHRAGRTGLGPGTAVGEGRWEADVSG